MDGNVVKLVFQAVMAGSGFAKVNAETSEHMRKMGKMSQGVQIMGRAFGNLGGIAGRSLGMLLQGGAMATLAENVNKVVASHAAIKAAVAAKGVAVPDGARLTDMAALVAGIGADAEPPATPTLTVSDFELIPAIYREPDRVEPGGTKDTFVCVMADGNGSEYRLVVDSKARLRVKTFYKRKIQGLPTDL